ncbi:hypothetical protein [Sphingopyxis sp. PET50]|uniref:hypothetical protein n=1 Tax=Sphingopyxis sp. PET50 TaxID=2976533 RepID=UPI0021AEAA97|nr:hypothetical protein [Sphingopyxis sp. PET50]
MMTGRRLLLAPLLALPLLAATPGAPGGKCEPARAGWDLPEARLSIQREGRGETLLIEGKIDRDLPVRLKAMLAEHPDIGAVHFNSAGGDGTSAMEAGAIIRSIGGFVTHVPAGAECTGACALLFLSGHVRSVDPSAVFDLGHFYDPPGGSTSEADVARQSLAVSGYLIRMGVSRRLLTGTLDRDAALPAAAPRQCLTGDELHSYNVANWNE